MADNASLLRRLFLARDGFRRLRTQSGVKRSPATSLSSESLSEARKQSATAWSD
jgi:hypothetical protein